MKLTQQTARVLRDGRETVIPIEQVQVGAASALLLKWSQRKSKQ